GCKWVFKKKTDMDGNVITFKGRLVAKGFKQIHGIDYDETFSPVAMLKSIQILFAIAAHYDYEIWQMDVKTAFLNGKLLEDVYIHNLRVLSLLRMPIRCASCKAPSMD
ncbi:reverse transcriptase domain-containing protein, partial [Escherichia coli]|uniref:reverse transcriptase domain-containing protein n=1 Tax=Escherichia coli TaxID=562 RepID=UPI0024B1C320